MVREFFSFSALLSVVVLAAGCSDGSPYKPVPVSGQVLYQGKPVSDAVVTFLWTSDSPGRSASGKTDAEGNFQLTTIRNNDGAVPGDYAVTIAKTDAGGASFDVSVDAETGTYGDDYGAMMEAAASGKGMDKFVANSLPEKYSSAATSDIKRSVVEGLENEFVIELE